MTRGESPFWRGLTNIKRPILYISRETGEKREIENGYNWAVFALGLVGLGFVWYLLKRVWMRGALWFLASWGFYIIVIAIQGYILYPLGLFPGDWAVNLVGGKVPHIWVFYGILAFFANREYRRWLWMKGFEPLDSER